MTRTQTTQTDRTQVHRTQAHTTQTGWHRRWIIPVFVLVVMIVTWAVWSYGYRRALDQLALQAEADLALASDRLTTQLQVYQELAVWMADHPGVQGLEGQADRGAAQALMLDVADKTGALDVAYADVSGQVLAAAQPVSEPNVSGSVAFQRALHGALGREHGVLGEPGRRAYIYAAPVFADDGAVRGAVIVTTDVEDVEQTWRGSLPSVYFTDATGEVFISNRSELLFWRRSAGGAGLHPAQGRAPEFRAWHVGSHEIWQLGWGPYVPSRGVHLAVDLPVIDMVGEILVDVSPARRIAGVQAAALAAVFLAFGGVLFMAAERRRTLAQTNAALEHRVQARTRDLSAANDQLRREIAERKDAEAALKQAQAELVQAGKLSALGQMSAGISHELNQPLMAIQQFADNGSAFLARGKTDKADENLGRISDMAARMARIIKNLRAFARNESEPMGKVDLAQVLTTAIELTENRLHSESVVLEWQPPSAQIHAWGGDVRLVQVFVNLINNAVDAMMGQDERRIVLTLEAAERLQVTVRDTGPGIADPDKIFEPFYTTRTVGASDGMGLGLSISYGLVQSFGGRIDGANAPDGGAVFTVELEYWTGEKSA